MADLEPTVITPTVEEEKQTADETVDAVAIADPPSDDSQEDSSEELAAGASPSLPLDLEPEITVNSSSKVRVYEGTCKWFSVQKGFGFIEVHDDDVPKDIWVHASNIETESGDNGSLEDGQKCTLEISKRAARTSKESASFSAQHVIPGERPKKIDRPKAKRHKGVCLFFDPDKQFGFIQVDGMEKRIFVHEQAIMHGKVLVEDQPCDFEIEEQEDGRLRAQKVNPGKAPPVDPERSVVHSGTIARWFKERGFGFIRQDKNPSEEQIMVHRSNLKSTATDLVEGQIVKYKINKRRRRDGADKDPQLEAVDVVPGEVPKPKIFRGVCKFFDADAGYGFIQRKGNSKDDYFVHQQQIISDDPTPVLEVGQECVFTHSIGKQGKPRAINVRPGAKEDETKPNEDSTPEEVPFDAYLPSHSQPTAVKKGSSSSIRRRRRRPSDSSSEEASTPNALDDMNEEQRLRREFNWRKKQRRKRSKDRQAEESRVAPDNGSNDDDGLSSTPPRSPTVVLPPVKKQKLQKKSKSVQSESKEKEPKQPKDVDSKQKNSKKSQQTSDQPRQQQQQQQPSKVLFRKNLKQKKRSAAQASKRKRIEDRKAEAEAVSKHFDAKKVEKQNESAGRVGFLTWVFRWVRSWC